jgi:5-methylcytosine-specific restriction endonuclease McrA
VTSSASKFTPSKSKLLALAKTKLNAHRPHVRRIDVFRLAAKALGRAEPKTKALGYALLAEFCHTDVPRKTGKPKRRDAAGKVGNRGVWQAANSDDFLQSYEWRKLRMVVIKKRGTRCECCGASPKDGRTVINVDHIQPRRLHPELALEESNLQVLCHECNHGKGNWDQTDWRRTKEDEATAIARELLALVPVLDMVQ